MRRRAPLALLLLALATGLGACDLLGATQVPASTGDYVPGELLVKLKPGASAAAIAAAHQAAGGTPRTDLGDGLWLVAVPAGREAEAMASYARAEAIAYAEVNRRLQPAMVGNFRMLDGRTIQMAAPRDPYYPSAAPITPTSLPRPGLPGQSWVFESTKILDAWDKSMGSPQIKVAVLDTGVDMAHEDLVANLDTASAKNYMETGKAPEDDFGHGTHVTGIIAAAVNNLDGSNLGVGIAGVAPACKIIPVRVMGTAGGTSLTLRQGLDWARTHGARVINLSLGAAQYSRTEEEGIQACLAAGIVVVAAAGNEAAAGNPVSYPAALKGVIAVGALAWGSNGFVRAEFSNYNPFVSLSAPGVDILSTVPGTFRSLNKVGDAPYAYASGTSMAAPIVSGIAALMLSQNGALTPADVLTRLKAAAADLGPTGPDPFFGAGLVQAGPAMP